MAKRVPTSTSTTNSNDINVLKQKALMVRLTIKNINRNKTDKDLAVIIHDAKKVGDPSTVRVNKSILPKARTDVFMKVSAQGKKYFYEVTSPWDDRGWRLLSIDIFKDFVKKFKAYTTDYKSKVLDFVDDFKSAVEEMQAADVLGNAFKNSDYEKWFNRDGSVNREALLENFALEVEYDTVTTGNDLAASLTAEDREALTDEINARATAKFANVQKDVAGKLHKAIAKMHERLSNTENTFRDTLTGNIEELVDIIPMMNIANDPELNKLAEEARATLLKFDPQTLRDDDKARKEISDAADKMAKNLEGMI
jgi:hypothetical protein